MPLPGWVTLSKILDLRDTEILFFLRDTEKATLILSLKVRASEFLQIKCLVPDLAHFKDSKYILAIII